MRNEVSVQDILEGLLLAAIRSNGSETFMIVDAWKLREDMEAF